MVAVVERDVQEEEKMTTIYRFDLPVVDEFTLSMPEFSRILCVGERGGTGHMWVMLNPELKKVERKFRIIGTGHPIPDSAGLEYIGTFFMASGKLVWHVFESN